ncbi:MAG TPA: PIN domain-containing protein [Verrucomicrobiae bacterium]
MPQSVIIDSSALVALLDPRNQHHFWARSAVANLPLPWLTCEPVITETFFLLDLPESGRLDRLLRDGRLRVVFGLRDDVDRILDLKHKYAAVPISLADACLVRMTETLRDPIIVTTDADFKIYRRHGRNVVPCLMP